MHSTIFVTFQRLSQCQDLSVSTTFWPSSCSLHQANDNKQTHTHTHMYPQTHITSGVFMQNSGGNETVVIHLCGQERKSHPYRPKNIGEKHALSMSKERGGQGTLTTVFGVCSATVTCNFLGVQEDPQAERRSSNRHRLPLRCTEFAQAHLGHGGDRRFIRGVFCAKGGSGWAASGWGGTKRDVVH